MNTNVTKRAPYYLELTDDAVRMGVNIKASVLRVAYATLEFCLRDAADLAKRYTTPVVVSKAVWNGNDRCDERICKVSP